MGTKRMYTEQDVRAYYVAHADELSSEQLQAIAYTWNVIDKTIDQIYGCPCPGENFSDIKEPLMSSVAQIIDGSNDIEDIETRVFIARSKYDDVHQELHFAQIAQAKLKELS